jgi:hypothetical protein
MTTRGARSIEKQAAEAVAEAEAWRAGLEAMAERIGPRFARSEARERAKVYLMEGLAPGARQDAAIGGFDSADGARSSIAAEVAGDGADAASRAYRQLVALETASSSRR